MLKKFFLVSFLLTCFSSSYAQEEINIVWGFNIGSNQANTIRGMIEELNTSQNHYRFTLVHRPGAGGTIAANSVASSPNNTIVAMSSSFIIRPYFEKDTSTHDLNLFTPILVQGNGAPLFVVSHNLSKIQDLVNRSNATIGVSGVGSISHLVANEFVALNPSIRIINFRNMIDATTAAAGGHIDAAIGFYVDLQSLVDAKKLLVLGYTGSKPIVGFENLMLTKNGFPEAASVTANYAMYASTTMTQERFQKIRSLLTWVNRSPKTRESYAKDQMIPSNLDIRQTNLWYESERKFWKNKVDKITSKVENN